MHILSSMLHSISATTICLSFGNLSLHGIHFDFVSSPTSSASSFSLAWMNSDGTLVNVLISSCISSNDLFLFILFSCFSFNDCWFNRLPARGYIYEITVKLSYSLSSDSKYFLMRSVASIFHAPPSASKRAHKTPSYLSCFILKMNSDTG